MTATFTDADVVDHVDNVEPVRNRSAHHCTGQVALPAPNDVCSRPCHILCEVAVYLADLAPAESCT